LKEFEESAIIQKLNDCIEQNKKAGISVLNELNNTANELLPNFGSSCACPWDMDTGRTYPTRLGRTWASAQKGCQLAQLVERHVARHAHHYTIGISHLTQGVGTGRGVVVERACPACHLHGNETAAGSGDRLGLQFALP